MGWIFVVVMVLAAVAGAWHRGWFPAARAPDPEQSPLGDPAAGRLTDPAEVRTTTQGATRRLPRRLTGVVAFPHAPMWEASPVDPPSSGATGRAAVSRAPAAQPASDGEPVGVA